MTRILVAVDGSAPAERACEFALERLRLHGVHVRVLTVLSHAYDPYTLLGDALEDRPERKVPVRRDRSAVGVPSGSGPARFDTVRSWRGTTTRRSCSKPA